MVRLVQLQCKRLCVRCEYRDYWKHMELWEIHLVGKVRNASMAKEMPKLNVSRWIVVIQDVLITEDISERAA